jgi:hypothetical protein
VELAGPDWSNAFGRVSKRDEARCALKGQHARSRQFVAALDGELEGRGPPCDRRGARRERHREAAQAIGRSPSQGSDQISGMLNASCIDTRERRPSAAETR